MTAAPFLPPHVIRFSRRAKRVILRVAPGKGLEVVLPAHLDSSCVPEALARNRSWIERQISRMAAPEPCALPPECMPLKGGREIVRIRITPPPCSQDNLERHRVHASDGRAPAPAPCSDRHASEESLPFPMTQPPPLSREIVLPDGGGTNILRGLRRWVREEARIWLGGLLEDLALEHGFSFTSMSVRFQKSRWGSCSIKGRINLNACLLFLPERLVRYIILHELCHTRQMNHSPAFWKLVFAADPEALTKDRALRAAWKFVPAWVQAED